MMKTTFAVSSPVSWASVVKGPTASTMQDAVSDSIGPLIPGTRGDHSCPCRGQVVSMLSHYGWVTAFEDIDHPLARRHFGRIYVKKSDVIGEGTLAAGDIVSFYLYADHIGLGAEACFVETQASESGKFKMHGMRADATEFVPKESSVIQGSTDMYARMSRVFNSVPANGYVQMAGVINSAYFDDDSTEGSDDGNDDADKESVHDDSEYSSWEGVDIVTTQKWEVAPQFHAPWKAACRPSSPEFDMGNVSTATGLTSDSDWDSDISMQMAFRPPPGLPPPPGLEKQVLCRPPWLTPPPGLG